MRIGLIDVDASSTNKNSYPNLVLMKLSAWHKAQGDSVEWFYPLSGHFDKVYMSKDDKESLPRGHELKKLQRWVNNKIIFRSCDTFQEYSRQGDTE